MGRKEREGEGERISQTVKMHFCFQDVLGWLCSCCLISINPHLWSVFCWSYAILNFNRLLRGQGLTVMCWCSKKQMQFGISDSFYCHCFISVKRDVLIKMKVKACSVCRRPAEQFCSDERCVENVLVLHNAHSKWVCDDVCHECPGGKQMRFKIWF